MQDPCPTFRDLFVLVMKQISSVVTRLRDQQFLTTLNHIEPSTTAFRFIYVLQNETI